MKNPKDCNNCWHQFSGIDGEWKDDDGNSVYRCSLASSPLFWALLKNGDSCEQHHQVSFRNVRPDGTFNYRKRPI